MACDDLCYQALFSSLYRPLWPSAWSARLLQLFGTLSIERYDGDAHRLAHELLLPTANLLDAIRQAVATRRQVTSVRVWCKLHNRKCDDPITCT